VILAGTDDVYPDWVLCGFLLNWDTCHNVANRVGQAEIALSLGGFFLFATWSQQQSAKGTCVAASGLSHFLFRLGTPLAGHPRTEYHRPRPGRFPGGGLLEDS
jgi:hypothetical protein